MATQNNGPEFTLELSGTVTEFAAVRLVSGKGQVTAGTANDDRLLVGVAQEAGVSGDKIRIRSINTCATSKMVAATAIALGAEVYTAAFGRVIADPTSLTHVGVALEAATATGDVIEVVRVKAANDDVA